jgi:hypothetical protein
MTVMERNFTETLAQGRLSSSIPRGMPLSSTAPSRSRTYTSSSGWPTTSIRRDGLRLSLARSSPIWWRRANAYSKAGVPDATSMAMIDVAQPV